MRDNKVIVFTAYDRPQYVKQTIESLRQCYGVEEYLLIPFVEPVHQEVIDLFHSIDYADLELHINSAHIGHTQNTYNALECGFSKSEYVILLESDDIFGKDLLRFHEHCKDKFKDDKTVYTVAGGHYHSPKRVVPEENIFAYERRPGFTNRGWGTWVDRWDEKDGMKYNWESPEYINGNVYVHQYQHGGWDHYMNNDLRGDRVEVLPALSRVKNIGWSGGRHVGFDTTKYTSIEEWYAEEVDLVHWAGDERILDKPTYHDINSNNLL
jgi:hypothetical protein